MSLGVVRDIVRGIHIPIQEGFEVTSQTQQRQDPVRDFQRITKARSTPET